MADWFLKPLVLTSSPYAEPPMVFHVFGPLPGVEVRIGQLLFWANWLERSSEFDLFWSKKALRRPVLEALENLLGLAPLSPEGGSKSI